MGASLLVFKNKSDVAGCLGEEAIRQVSERLQAGRGIANDHDHTGRPSSWTASKHMAGKS